MEMKRNKTNQLQVKNSLGGIVLALITILVVIPFLWVIMMSLKSNSDIMGSPLSLPAGIHFDNFVRAIDTLKMFTLYKNTFIIVFLTLSIEVIITFMSSYALSRLVFRSKMLKHGLTSFLLAGLYIPVFILLFPVYRVNVMLGFKDTYYALVLPYIATSISFNTLLFIGFLKEFPKSLEEAAIIDGCSLIGLCKNVVFPVIKPVTMTVFIFNVLYVWNEFPFAVTMINKETRNTISLGISQFQGRFSFDYGAIIAASILIMLPQVIFYGLLQKYIIEGMTAGAIKG